MDHKSLIIGAAIGLAALLVGAAGGFFLGSARGPAEGHGPSAPSSGHAEHDGRGDHSGHAGHEGQGDHESPKDEGHAGHAGHDEKSEGDGGHGEHEQEPGTHAIELSEQQAKNIDIAVEEVRAGSATGVIERPATVMWNLDAVSRVGPRISAKVVDVKVDLGTHVKRGQVLAVMSSVELGRAKADYLAARAQLETRKAAYERQRTLRKKEIASEASLLEAKAAYREARATRDAAREKLRVLGLTKKEISAIEAGTDEALSRFRLRSPTAGAVQKRHLAVGETVGRQETPIHVVDTSTMWVMIEGYERDVPLLATGKSATLTSRSLPESTFTGKIDWISRALEEETRTVRMRAVVKNPNGALKAGMYGTARVHTRGGRDAVLVPLDAVQKVHGHPVVFVPAKKGGRHYRLTRVTTGAESVKHVEVVSGLDAGTQVVTEGAFDLKAAFTAKGRSAAHSH